ncbi:MAG: permease, partial [Verrucomicrobiales bacterium]|nr:permease [Verrucomicrobiales bacterium]
MRLHIDLQAQENIASGMSPGEALLAARREFGWVESIKERCREERGITWLEHLIQDIRFGARQLRKNPAFAAVAILTVGLGVGVNTSMFTALQRVMLRPLPYPDPGQLVQLFTTSPGDQRSSHSAANFLDLRSRNRDFEFVAALNSDYFNLSDSNQNPERISGFLVSSEYFPLLGIQPALGRVFTSDEDKPGANNVVVLENGFWQRRFAGDTNILGKVIRLNGENVTIIGVMPELSRDTMLAGPGAIWRPIAFTPDQAQNRGGHYLKVIGRLKPGIALAQGQAGADVLAAALARDYPDNNAAQGLKLVPLAQSSLPPEGRRLVWLTMTLSTFVLLIACANLANLQFARTATRNRELAIRGALGAPRSRIIRQLLTESFLIAFLGGLLGLILAIWGNDILNKQLLVEGENILRLSLNYQVLAFALGASTLSGLGFGLLPAWLASRTQIDQVIKQNSRGNTSDRSHHRLQHGLIVIQVALALILLSGAALVIRGMQKFASLDPGWKIDGLTLGYLNLPSDKYQGNEIRSFSDALLEKFKAIPGVESGAITWTLPVRQFNVSSTFNIPGRPPSPRGHEPDRFVNGTTPGYFQTIGMHFIEGRDFTSLDRTNSPKVTIINDVMARTFWPGESPIGKKIDDEEIVGVVNTVKFPANPFEVRTSYQTYRPFAQEPRGFLTVIVRGNISADLLRKKVMELDSDLPVGEPGSARANVGKSLDNLA